MAKSEDLNFEKQLEKFIENSRLKGLSEAEIRDCAGPLIKQIRREITFKLCKVVLKLALVLVVIFFAIFCTPLYFHMRAAGRIGLIKINPYWDWSKLYYENCLVENNVGSRDNLLEEIECTVCEDMKGIEVMEKVQPKFLYDHYISQEQPVIISDGALSWQIFHDEQFWFGNISEAYERLHNESGSQLLPCNFMTNLRIRNGLHDLFREIYQQSTKPFFAHWENCDKASVKALRQFYERPYFISAAVDTSFHNWILVSSLYEASIFRNIDLNSNLALVVQIRGYNRFRLEPHGLCSKACRDIEMNLEEGEILVVPSSLWSLKYQPGENSDNLAFIIQAEMD